MYMLHVTKISAISTHSLCGSGDSKNDSKSVTAVTRQKLHRSCRHEEAQQTAREFSTVTLQSHDLHSVQPLLCSGKQEIPLCHMIQLSKAAL